MQNTFREYEVDCARTEGQMQSIALDKVGIPHMTESRSGNVNSIRNVDAYPGSSPRPERCIQKQRRGKPAATPNIKNKRRAIKLTYPRLGALKAIFLKIPVS